MWVFSLSFFSVVSPSVFTFFVVESSLSGPSIGCDGRPGRARLAVEVVQGNVEQFDQFGQAGLVLRVDEAVPDEKVQRRRAARRLVVRRQDALHHLGDGHQLERLHLAVRVARHEIRRKLKVVHKLRIRKQASFTLEIEPKKQQTVID